MSEKIILFLGRPEALPRETLYLCPGDTVVPGILSNDAPVRYLLQTHPDIREVLCIVDPAGEEEAVPAFRRVVEQAAPAVTVTVIPSSSREDFILVAIPRLLTQISPGDQIWLDFSGAAPESMMYLLLLSRALACCGTPTLGAVTVSQTPDGTPQVRDVTHLIRLFDLLGGMQDLTGKGNVQVLRRYCAHSGAGSATSSLLDALEELTEAVSLCRTSEIPGRMDRFSDALERAEQFEDPLMRRLLETFRSRFRLPGGEEERRLTIPGLIQWYLSNGQEQYALTVFTEQVPAYLIRDLGLIAVGEEVPREVPMDYEDPLTVQFQQGFLKLSDRRNPAKMFRRYLEDSHQQLVAVVRRQAPLESLTPPRNLAAGVDNLVRITRLAYPREGRFEPAWASRLPRRKAFLRSLEDRLSRQPPKTPEALLKKAAQFPKQDLWVLLEQDAAALNLPTEALTVELLADLLPGSGYSITCPLEQMALLCRDYLYLKMMRSLASHASRAMTVPQQELVRYLGEHNEGGYYTPPDRMTTGSLRHSLSCCLEHLRQAALTRREAGEVPRISEEEVSLREASAEWETGEA